MDIEFFVLWVRRSAALIQCHAFASASNPAAGMPIRQVLLLRGLVDHDWLMIHSFVFAFTRSKARLARISVRLAKNSMSTDSTESIDM